MNTQPQLVIHLQDDFQNFIDEFEVSYRDYNLTEATWIKAEEAMLNSKVNKSDKVSIHVEVDTTEIQEQINEMQKKVNQMLTQADFQVLTSILKDIIDTKNYAVSWQKEYASKLWGKCDKNNEATKNNFNRLKSKLDELDKHNKRLKSLVNIQKKLKYLRDN